jgi:hypothetical protein
MTTQPIIEEAEFVVRISLTNVVSFSPAPRDKRITRQDAIANAEGSLPDGWLAAAEAEGWTVEFTAERMD